MLMHIDQARHDDRTGGVENFIKPSRRWSLCRRADGSNSGVFDRYKSARIELSPRIDRYDDSILDQFSIHWGHVVRSLLWRRSFHARPTSITSGCDLGPAVPLL